MFTLGDVADILDSALDTGISIVDALAKLSDVAETGPIDRNKAFDTLNIAETNGEVRYRETNGDVRYRKNRRSKQVNDLKIEEFDEKHASSFNDGDYDAVSYDNKLENSSEHQKDINIENSISKSAFLREKGLKYASNLNTEDAAMQGLPIIQALGDLCNVADNFLNDYDDIESAVDSHTEKPKVDHTELEHVINDKVNQILESFKKLDLTVDQLSQKILKEDSKSQLNQSHDREQQPDNYSPTRHEKQQPVKKQSNEYYHQKRETKKYNAIKRGTYTLNSPTHVMDIFSDNNKMDDDADYFFHPSFHGNMTNKQSSLSHTVPNNSTQKTQKTDAHRGTYVLSSDDSNDKSSSDIAGSSKSIGGFQRETYVLSRDQNPKEVKLEKRFSLDLQDDCINVSENVNDIETPDSSFGIYSDFRRKLSEPNYELTLPITPDMERSMNQSLDNLNSSFSSDHGHFLSDTESNQKSRNQYQFHNLKSSSSHTLLPHGYKLMSRKYSYGLMPLSDRSASQPALHIDGRKRSVPITAPVMNKLSTLHSALSSSLNKLNKLHEIQRDISLSEENLLTESPSLTTTFKQQQRKQTITISKHFTRSNSAPSEFSDNFSLEDNELAVNRQFSNSSGGTYTIISPSESYQFIGKENSFVLIDSNESDKDDLLDNPDYYSSPVPHTRNYLSPDPRNNNNIPDGSSYYIKDGSNKNTQNGSNNYTQDGSNEYLADVNNIIQNLEDTLALHEDENKNIIKPSRKQVRKIDRNSRTGTYVIRSEKKRPSSVEIFENDANTSEETLHDVNNQKRANDKKNISKNVLNDREKIKTSNKRVNYTVINQDKEVTTKRPSLGIKSKTFSAGDEKQRNTITNKTTKSKKSPTKGEPKAEVKHTNFLRRKSKGYGLSNSHITQSEYHTRNDIESRDEPLSSRLAALRMQLEEKRRQFEEEKKRKQEEWSQERGKMLTSAYLRMNGKENEDPDLLTTTGLTSWEVHFDETPSQSSINKTEYADEKTAMTSPTRPYMSPREYIRQKQLEQKLDQSPTKEGLWFVDLSNDNMTSPIDHAQRAFLFDSTRKFSEQQGNSPLQTPHNSQQQQRQVNEQQRQTKEENPPQEEFRKSSDSLTRLKALRDVTSEHSGHVNRHVTERSDHVTLQRSSLSQVDSLQNEVNNSQDEVSRSYRYNKSFSHEERPSIEDSSQHPVSSNVRPINSVPNTPSQVPITRNFDFVSQPDLSRSSPVQPFTTPSLTRNFENMNLYDETNGTVSHVGDNATKHFSRHYDGDNGSLNTSYNCSGDRANMSTHEQYKGDNACSESYHHLSYGMSEEYRQNNPTEYQRLQHERHDENRLKESTGYHQLPHLIMKRTDEDNQKESAGYHQLPHLIMERTGEENQRESTGHHQLPHLIMERTDEDNQKESAGYHQLPHLIMERTDLKESTGYHQLPHLMERSDQNKVSTHDVHISPVQNGAVSPSEPTSTTHHVFDRNYVENVYNQDEGSINTVNAQQLEQRDSLKSQQSSSTNENAVSDHMEQIIYDHPPPYTNEESTHAHNEFHPREQQSHLITNNSVDSTHARNEFHTLDQESPMVTNRSVVSIETDQPLNSEIYITESCSKDENFLPPAGNVQPPLQQLQFSTPTKNTEVLPLTSQIDEAAVDLTKTPSDKPSAWALNFGDEFQSPEMTPEQKKKRDRFIRNRQKKLEEERAKKEAEQEKKRRKEQLLAEQKEKEEEARMREIERQKEAELEQATSDLQQEFYAKRLHEMTYQTNTPERQLNRPLSHRVQARETGDRPTHPRVQSANAASPNRRFGQGTPAYGGSTEHLPSQFFEYKGPSAYQKPSGKSNRKIIQNAITHCCLCGEVNKDAKTKCLEALSESEGNHFLVLFREGLKFRSVYEYHPEAEIISRIYGIGPKTITTKMIAKYFKYNSGGKEFNELDTKHLSIQIDGVMIKKELWEKKNTPSKTNSNVARKKSTPRSGVNR